MKTIIFSLFFITNLFCQINRGSISGIVTNYFTKKPISGAVVTIQNSSFGAITDSMGFYKINLPFGKYLAFYRDMFYTAKKMMFEITSDNPAKEITIGLKIEPDSIGIVDTIHYEDFSGYIRDKHYIPKYKPDLFRGERFIPSPQEIIEAENSIILQYVDAVYECEEKKYEHHLKFDRLEEINEFESPKKKFTPVYKLSLLNNIKTEYSQFDREYYGFIGNKGTKKIRIEFLSHTAETYLYVGEEFVYELPTMIYDLSTKKLSFESNNDD